VVEAGGPKVLRQLTLSGAFFSRCNKAARAEDAAISATKNPAVMGTDTTGIKCAAEGQRGGASQAQVGDAGKAGVAGRGEAEAVEQRRSLVA